MSGPENTFIASVHKHLPPINEFYRMKNHNEYNGGIADCWYSAERDLWIEYKFIVLPKRDDTLIDLQAGKKPSLSALQAAWITARRTEGRNVWLIVGCNEGGVVDPGLTLFDPIRTNEFRGRLFSRSEVAQQIRNFCR